MKGDITDLLLQTLAFGPMSVHEIAFETGEDTRKIRRAARNCIRTMPRLGKRVYVKEWVKRRTANPNFQQQLYCPIYALGSKPCAKKPKTQSGAEKLRELRARKKKIASNSSIFKLSEAA